VLAVAGGSELLKRTQQVFFQKKPSKISKVSFFWTSVLLPLCMSCLSVLSSLVCRFCHYLSLSLVSVSLLACLRPVYLPVNQPAHTSVMVLFLSFS